MPTTNPRTSTAAARLRRFVLYVGPLLLWMGVIFAMSTDRGSAANTRPVVASIVRRVFPDADRYLRPEQIDRVDWNIRKSAHVCEYTVLGLLAFRAVAYGDRRFRSRNVVLPLLIGLLYAASDEWHQSFVPSRGAAAADVFFDFFGVLSGVTICLWRRLLRTEA